jgi:ribosome maturation factor RimP
LEKGSRPKEELSQTIEAIEAIVTELGYECVNVALTTEEGRCVLRILIDTLGGINIGDCEKVSKAVNRYLDGKDAGDAKDAKKLSDKYYLEVSSPGLERPLFTPADYERFRGKEARIKTHGVIEGRKTHLGFIQTSDEGSVTLATEEGTRNIPFDAVARATLVFRGLEPQKPPKTASAKPRGKQDKERNKKGKKKPETIETYEEEH